jgi:hypothetical protein
MAAVRETETPPTEKASVPRSPISDATKIGLPNARKDTVPFSTADQFNWRTTRELRPEPTTVAPAGVNSYGVDAECSVSNPVTGPRDTPANDAVSP